MSNLYKRYETSKKLANEGAPFRLIKNEDGTVPTMWIARSDNSNQVYQKGIQRIFTREVTESLKDLNEDQLHALNVKAFVTCNLMSWENVRDREDEVLVFSPDNAEKLFIELPELFVQVNAFAQNMANYLKVNEEKAVKN